MTIRVIYLGWFLPLVLATNAAAQLPQSLFFGETREGRMERIVGAGRWEYTWPDNLTPEKIAGYRLTDWPTEKTMGNWGQTVVFEDDKSDSRVSIWCNRDASKDIIGPGYQPSIETRLGCFWSFTKEDFQNQRAESAQGLIMTPWRPTGYVVRGNGAAFIFRFEDTLYRLEAMAAEGDAMRAARDIAEAIYQYRQNAAAEQQQATPRLTKQGK